jgi:hypothetical protein
MISDALNVDRIAQVGAVDAVGGVPGIHLKAWPEKSASQRGLRLGHSRA